MKRDKPSKDKVNPENPESKVSEIQKLCKLLMQDADKFAAIIRGLNPPLSHEGAKVFSSFANQLALYVFLIPDMLLVTLQHPDEFPGQLETLLKDIKIRRLEVWFLKTIFENTPNLPWEKIDKYITSHPPIPIETYTQQQKDRAMFYLTDKLGFLRTNKMKSMFSGRAEQYLKKNVFEKLEKGEIPPETKNIKESIIRATKREKTRERSGTFTLHGRELEEVSGEFRPTYLDLPILKALVEDNPNEQLVEFLDDQRKIEKLREAYNILTNRQKQVIRLRFFDDLTLEEASKELGIDLSTTYEHEKAAIEKIKKALLS